MNLLVTVLCGGRPKLLSRTLSSFASNAPEVAENARVVVLLNGDDPVSDRVLADCPWIDEVLRHCEGRLPIGKAISKLMDEAQVGRAEHLLHLEDDWNCLRGGWWPHALEVLRREKKVGQVRLRRWFSSAHPQQSVSRYHMLTRRVLKWQERRGSKGRYAVARAHFTFNPTVVPTSVAGRVYPCRDEMDAAHKFNCTRLLAAQLLPGAFAHLGVGDLSLREKTGGA